MSFRTVSRIGLASALIAAGLAGCRKTPEPTTQNFATDPSNGNLANANPGDGNVAAGSPANAAPAQPSGQYPVSPPPPSYSAAAYSPASSSDQSAGSYSEPETLEASAPPPPLPEYGQPECPGDNYIWTPGYWSYGTSSGYYWVPGAWVVAPYVDALWTPPYWESYSGRYRWHRGYWAQHLGFYGGIDYGFGYTGRGYSGGYWRGGVFNYNRAANNVNVSRVHNVYNYNIADSRNATRVSYNGGRGGVDVRPTAPELAVRNEQRVAPVAAQAEHMRRAEGDRGQFASVNQGRPQMVVATTPLATPYKVPAPRAAQAPVAVPEQRRNETPYQRVDGRDAARNETRPNGALPPPPPPQQPASPQERAGRMERTQRDAPPVPQPAERPTANVRPQGPAATPPFFSHRDAAPAPQQVVPQERQGRMERTQREVAPVPPPNPQPRTAIAPPQPAPQDRERHMPPPAPPQNRPAPEARPQPQMQMRAPEPQRAQPQQHEPAAHPQDDHQKEHGR